MDSKFIVETIRTNDASSAQSCNDFSIISNWTSSWTTIFSAAGVVSGTVSLLSLMSETSGSVVSRYIIFCLFTVWDAPSLAIGRGYQ